MEVTLELYKVFDILDGILTGDYPDVEPYNRELTNLVYDAKVSLSRLYTYLHDMKNKRWSNVQSSRKSIK
jgi:hypothetical protein